MAGITDILDSSYVYRLWQSPFVGQKIQPMLRHNVLDRTTRVLDVGCGPGTNAAFFAECDHYVGVDMNPRYIESARRRYGRDFVTADVRTYLPGDDEGYDFILANSFFHHIDDDNTRKILQRLHELLRPKGEIHILDLVLPTRPSIARWLARNDRGNHPRLLDSWRALFGSIFSTFVFEPYSVKFMRVPLWQMVYFKGQKLQQSEGHDAIASQKIHAT